VSRRHARARRLPVPRTLGTTLGTVVGVAALATAAVGAADFAQEQTTSASALSAPASPSRAERARALRAQALRATAIRRAQVMEATRSYTRTGLDGTDAREVTAAEHGADVRARQLARVAEAVAERSAAIERELARQQRLEEQRERELARQRRIERMNRWVVPVNNYEITATFGTGGSLWSSDHTGLDFAAVEGTPVHATAAGEVTSTGYDGAYGNQVVITHEDGTETWYCHLSSISVSSGESVEAGTTIGAVGSTGNTTGPHLHLEVRPGGGDPIDPYTYLQERGAL
jgi:murein DD-endopeptidase MepM/ murein hydrolase activator NlpD